MAVANAHACVGVRFRRVTMKTVQTFKCAGKPSQIWRKGLSGLLPEEQF